MSLLQEDKFCHQFGNQHRAPKPYCRRKTYLCYQLDGPINDKGCFQNKKKRHAEIRFINKIKSLSLDPSQRFEITCYITWSPCPTCAGALVDFVNHHAHLSLRIFASRLYFHWLKKNILGLRSLNESGVPMAVMGHPEFEDCWRKFVDQDKPFQPWKNLDQNSKSIKRRLQRILMPVNDLSNNFSNLKLE